MESVKTSNTVTKLLTKFKQKNRMLSLDSTFLVNVCLPSDEDDTDVGKLSIYCDKFECQLFKFTSESYKIGFQNINYLNDIEINNNFTLGFKENPDSNLSKLIYEYMSKIISGNKSRIINNIPNLFDTVYVFVFLDPIKKHHGNHFVYKFSNCKLLNLDYKEMSYNFNDSGLISKDLELSFKEVNVTFKTKTDKGFTEKDIFEYKI